MTLLRDKTGELKLYDNNRERSRFEDLADLYAIIKATDSLESAYGRGVVTPADYSETCKQLISQFKTVETALIASKIIVNADTFFREYQVDCPKAYERLIVSGMTNTWSCKLSARRCSCDCSARNWS